MDKKVYFNSYNLYNIYYYDDNKNKHLVSNIPSWDLNFIKDRFGKENVKVVSERLRVKD